jgi:hypothetical protein
LLQVCPEVQQAVAPQGVSPVGQLHVPLEQVFGEVQAIPQPPQWELLVLVLTQDPLQKVLPPEQTQLPPEQERGEEQVLLQPPQ